VKPVESDFPIQLNLVSSLKFQPRQRNARSFTFVIACWLLSNIPRHKKAIFTQIPPFNFLLCVLRFTPERSRWIRDEIWHEGQTESVHDDGSLVRTIPVSHEGEIMMEILKHGSQVEVLEPKWLREKIITEINESVKIYRV
jgi:hypothetical protein